MFKLFKKGKKMNKHFFKMDRKDQEEIKIFLVTYKKFVKKTVEKVQSKACISLLNEGINAFTKAIFAFEIDKNTDFESFADLKIRVAVAKKISSGKESIVRAAEIRHFKEQLDEFGVRFDDLVKATPKREEKNKIFGICDAICDDRDMSAYLLESKRVPVKKLMTVINVSANIYKKYECYIIAIALMHIFKYEYLTFL
ncbi:hypothetical protein [Bacillus thuringiensis]|uniref:hypothetical protein n=1 Tax=Bacillus thuringiensis TaxID=1428 RepID=UPI0021D65F47|nr:hypothetical protein [Bacillus thuringiensis]MCU7667284.1 hypothetical protein [Bacillus thuringiensis]